MRTIRYGHGIVCLLIVTSLANVALAQAITLDEPVTDTRHYRVTQVMKLHGTLKTPLPGGKSLPLKLKGEASQSFRQRRLAGTGRDAKALRMLRHYSEAKLEVTVGGEKSVKTLGSTSRLMVVQGESTGITIHSPSGPLSVDELELLQMPGDNLAILAFLPPEKVLVGKTWTPPSWGVQLLANIDAVAKSSVSCRLKSADEKLATVTFAGTVEGARDGAPTKITLEGEYLYNRRRGYVESVTLKQVENSTAGPISPALDVTAEIRVQRRLTDDPGPLSASAAASIPLEPNEKLLKLRIQPTPSVQFLIDRDWHIVHQSRTLLILRLVREGNLIAQVNIKPLPDAQPGKHIPEEKFQADIQAALGTRLKKLRKAEEIRLKRATDDHRFLYRVIAEGSDHGIEMQWTYYLCASPTGRQVSLVFAVEKKLIGQLDDADLEFVYSVRFLPEKSAKR